MEPINCIIDWVGLGVMVHRRLGWMRSMANGTAFACGWFVACNSGLCHGFEEGDICWFVGMVGMVGFGSLDALSWVRGKR